MSVTLLLTKMAGETGEQQVLVERLGQEVVGAAGARALSSMRPAAVNLTALLSRLITTWRSFSSSTTSAGSASM